MCFVVTCWEKADLLALVCGVLLWVCHFPIGILGQVWYLIVSIPDLCTLTYFEWNIKYKHMRCLKVFWRPDKRVYKCMKMNMYDPYTSAYTVKPVLSGHSKLDETKILMTNGA